MASKEPFLDKQEAPKQQGCLSPKQSLAAKYVGPGVVCAVIAVAIYFILQAALMAALNDEFIVSSTDSKGYSKWQYFDAKTTPSYVSYKMFNLTNAWDVVNNGAVPAVNEMGPYVYRFERERLNASFSNGGDDVDWTFRQTYYYEPSMTTGDGDEDRICMINPTWMGACSQALTESQLPVGTTASFVRKFVSFFQTDLAAVMTSQEAASMWSTISAGLIKKFGLDAFVNTWSNSPAPSAPAGGNWNGMLVQAVTGSAANIPVATGQKLFTDSQAYSLTDDSWDAARAWTNPQGNATAMSLLKTMFTLTDTQIMQLSIWRNASMVTLGAQAAMLKAKNCSSLTEFAYSQWATGAPTGKVSVSVLFPGMFPTAMFSQPEYWVPGFFTALTPADAQNAFEGPHGMSKSVANLNSFFLHLKGNNQTKIAEAEKIWNLSESQLSGINEYMLAVVMQHYGRPFLQQLEEDNLGIVACKTPTEWLFTDVDKLLGLIDPSTAHNGHFFINNTNVDAGVGPAGMVRFKSHTGFGNNKNLGEIETVDGSPTIGIWAETEQVQGTLGYQFHYNIQEGQNLTIWEQDLSRHLVLTPHPVVTTKTVRDVELLRYIVAPEMLEPNPKYYQTLPGFWNQTSAKLGTPIFVSRPHFNGANMSWVSRLNNMTYPNPATDFTELDIEPTTGSTLVAAKKVQVNLYLEDGNPWFPVGVGQGCPSYVCHPNIALGFMYPMVVENEHGSMSQAIADKIRHGVYVVQKAQIALPIVFGFFALALFGLAVCLTTCKWKDTKPRSSSGAVRYGGSQEDKGMRKDMA